MMPFCQRTLHTLLARDRAESEPGHARLRRALDARRKRVQATRQPQPPLTWRRLASLRHELVALSFAKELLPPRTIDLEQNIRY
jgi:hypothetical protein